jgi:MOSC domain-containing protein
MHIAALWRYPGKSMAGERLEVAEVRPDGIAGDRLVQVVDARGRVVTSRTRPRLLGLRGTVAPDGGALVNGRPWTSAEVARLVQAAAGEGAHLVRGEGLERFDVLPLLVATDGAIAALGVDGRRLRPNLVIGGVEGLAERSWPGRLLRVGDVVVAVASLRSRCVMTTFDPDDQTQDISVLHQIVREFGGRMALDCQVVRGGRIALGDPVEVLESA